MDDTARKSPGRAHPAGLAPALLGLSALALAGCATPPRADSERAVREAGVASIPLSALWEGEGGPTTIVRLCHCKPSAMLEEAVARLSAWRAGL
jgi:aspartate/methionine/tyrosine aminotransferase